MKRTSKAFLFLYQRTPWIFFLLFAAKSVLASNLFYDDLSANIFTPSHGNATSCVGCHGGGSNACTGTATATAFLGSYEGAAACSSFIDDKVSTSPGYGNRMPDGGPNYLSAAHLTDITNWSNNGAPKAASTATNPTSANVTKTTATLKASFNPNVWSGTSLPGTYEFEWGASTSYGEPTSPSNITGMSASEESINITGLTCSTPYHFKGVVTNGASSDETTNQTFTTSACTSPVISGASTVTMSEDGVPTAFSLTLSVTDNDPGTLTWSINGNGSKGTASVSGSGSSKSIAYSVISNVNGSDSFTVRVINGSTGLTDDHLVSVTINAVNDVPTAVNDSGVVQEGNSVTLNILSNDTDPETGIPTVVASTSNAVNGSVVINANNTVTFTHNDSETGTASFQYLANDGFLDSASPATVSLTVTSVNDAPIAVTDAIAVDLAGTTMVLQDASSSVLANDSDAENSMLNAVLVSDVSNGSLTLNSNGSFSYTHDGSGNLTDSFSYKANDGTLDSNTVAVNISIANLRPTAVNDSGVVQEGNSVTLNILSNDTDPETGIPTVVASTSNAVNGSVVINANNTVTFTHNDSETGSASFQYLANDGFLDSASPATVSLTVTPVNDAPTMASIENQTATESLAIDIITALASDADDANDGVQLTYSLSSSPAGMVVSNTSPTQGQINWVPPQTGVFNQLYGPITVMVADGGENGVSAASTSFSITVSPPDADVDLVPDYADFCPSIVDADNADNDGDATAGSDSDANDTQGGDVCDSDDDNDGMPDSYELANGFDPFDASDASEDADGDGVSNVDEFLAGTNPLFSAVTINATGYLTAYVLVPPEPAFIHPDATTVSPDNAGPYRPGKHSIQWTAANASNNNLVTVEQILNIIPLINLAADQQVVEGNTATVTVALNGLAANYPVTVDYSISGSASSVDHTAVDGQLSITASNTSAEINFEISDDALSDAGETVILTISSVSNAVIGSKAQHSISIAEGNVSPSATLRIMQNGQAVSSGFEADGLVTIIADVDDLNAGQSHQYNWQVTDNALLAPGDLASSSWTFVPSPGTYIIDLVATDDGSPALSAQTQRIFKVTAETPPVLAAVDTDGDGITDDVEGYGDSDNDGIPDYLDAVSEAHLLADQSVDAVNTYLLQTTSGLKLNVGNTSQAAAVFGALLTDADIANFGSSSGAEPINAEDDHQHFSGIYDFEISQLLANVSVAIVIPLQTAIPKNAVYRKFSEATGWLNFVENENNHLSSAPGSTGVCPEPGSEQYRSGLHFLDRCLQLLIEDGGPNDQDGVANGVIKDPGTIGVQLKPVAEVEVESGAIKPLFLITILLFAGYFQWLRVKQNMQKPFI